MHNLYCLTNLFDVLALQLEILRLVRVLPLHGGLGRGLVERGHGWRDRSNRAQNGLVAANRIAPTKFVLPWILGNRSGK